MRCERQTLEAEWKQAVMFSPRAHLNFTILEPENWHLGANGANKPPWPCPGGLSVSWARADFTHLRIVAVEIYTSPLPHSYLSNQIELRNRDPSWRHRCTSHKPHPALSHALRILSVWSIATTSKGGKKGMGEKGRGGTGNPKIQWLSSSVHPWDKNSKILEKSYAPDFFLPVQFKEQFMG